VGALIAIYWPDLGAAGFFIAFTSGFCAYVAFAAAAMLKVKEPAETATVDGHGLGFGGGRAALDGAVARDGVSFGGGLPLVPPVSSARDA
jgi:hypothetical protein